MSAFTEKAGALVPRLMLDLSIKNFQAAGILGNLGAESGLVAGIQEVHPLSGVGGLGWAQWTGPRRTQFVSYCAAHNQRIDDDEANYGFLLYELKGGYARVIPLLRATTTIANATTVFEAHYEMAGIKNYSGRISFAETALKLAGGVAPIAPLPPSPPSSPVAPMSWWDWFKAVFWFKS